MFRFTTEQREFIEANVLGKTNADLTECFNKQFSLNLRVKQIQTFKKNNKLSSGLTGRFEQGHTPSNKGKKKTWVGGEFTRFKQGHKPHNYMAVGSERVNGDGYVDIKIADPNRWRGKHLVKWELYNGRPVPKGHVVIFGDGDRRNFDSGNLILLTRGQLAIMNKHGLIMNDADLTRTGIIMADILKKIGERTRKL